MNIFSLLRHKIVLCGLLALLNLAWIPTAAAIEFRSVTAVAILYDAPSSKYGKKLYILRPYTPVEVILRSGEWARIREAEGGLAWIESKLLSSNRTLVVIAPQAEIRSSPQTNAPIVLQAAKWTALSLLKNEENGWVMVKHLSGTTGYAKAAQFWGS